jgi:hypothetical protein
MNKSLRTIALGAALFATGVGAPASLTAATQTGIGSSKVTVIVQDVIVLDYFTSINIGLAGRTESHGHGAYSQANIAGGDQSFTGTGSLTTSTIADASSSALTGADVTMTVKNVWAIRGFSTSGKATVSVSGPATLTKAATSSTIGLSKLQVLVDGNSTSTAGKSISADLKGIQNDDVTMGDVLMSLNFANTSLSGDYSGTITITAVTL